MTLDGKAVLITGASRGLGAALSRQLAAAGARLVLVARAREPLERLANELREQGAEAHALSADIGDKTAIHPLASAAAELVGPIDVLIHNASSLGPTPLRLLVDTECEDLERVLAVNLVGPFRLSRIIAGSMAVRGGGTLLHLSSDAAVSAYPRWGAYSVSKAALDHLSRLWAVELEPHGVRVLAVDPGDMDTELHAAAVPDADRAALADPSDVARRIAALLSEARVPSGARVEAARYEVAS